MSLRVVQPGQTPLGGGSLGGTYNLLSRLGGGGMGDVYEAEHVRLGTRVAVKVMRSGGDSRAAERFRREARRIAQVRSEHVVRVFDHGHLDDGTPYLVMDRLVGEDLRSLLSREGALPVRRAVQLVLDACRGLAAVHGAGFVHRDLKPANLFVERQSSGSEICKILDFGVARALEDSSTTPSAIVGTIRYMAPEQLANAASVTSSVDVYALGAVLYECLTGVPPHASESLEETMFDIVHRDVQPPSVHRPLPADLELALVRALSRDPAQRIASAEEFARALLPFRAPERSPASVAGADADTVVEAAPPLPSRPSRKHASTLLIAVAAGAVGAALGWTASPVRERVAASRPIGPSASIPVPERRAAVGEAQAPQPAQQPIASVPEAQNDDTTLQSAKAKRSVRPRSVPSAASAVAERAPSRAAGSSAARSPRFDPTDPYE